MEKTKRLTKQEKKDLIFQEIGKYCNGQYTPSWMYAQYFTVSKLSYYTRIPFSKSTIRKYLRELSFKDYLLFMSSDYSYSLTPKAKDLLGIDYKKNYCANCGLELGKNKDHWHALSCLPDVNRAYRGFLSDLIWKDDFASKTIHLVRSIRFTQAQFDAILKSYNILVEQQKAIILDEQENGDLSLEDTFRLKFNRERIEEHIEMLTKKAIELARLGRKYYATAKL